MFTQDTPNPLAGCHQPAEGKNKPASIWREIQEKILGVYRAYITEIIRLQHEPSSNMKSWKEKENGKINEHIASGIRHTSKERIAI